MRYSGNVRNFVYIFIELLASTNIISRIVCKSYVYIRTGKSILRKNLGSVLVRSIIRWTVSNMKPIIHILWINLVLFSSDYVTFGLFVDPELCNRNWSSTLTINHVFSLFKSIEMAIHSKVQNHRFVSPRNSKWCKWMHFVL